MIRSNIIWAGAATGIRSGCTTGSQKRRGCASRQGAAYLIGYFDGCGRLTRAVKMYRGEVFFDYAYRYHANGRLKSASVARGGRVTVLEYDARGRRFPAPAGRFDSASGWRRPPSLRANGSAQSPAMTGGVKRFGL